MFDVTLPQTTFSSNADAWKTWKFAGIYAIIHTESGKIYVGQAGNITNRIYQHRKLSSHCKHLSSAIQKYGWDAFEIVLFERVTDFSIIDSREQFWIDVLCVCNPKIGYNMCPMVRTTRGIKFSVEARANVSIARMGVKYPSRRKSSDETRAKMSMVRIGIPHEWARRAVFQFDTKTKMLIRTWPSLLEAGGSLGIGSGHISECCHNKRKTAGGFAWQFDPTGEKSCPTPQNV
jgi:hypothetical protein